MSSKLTRFREFPCDLFRIDTFKKIKLREYARQTKAGKKSFDFVLKDGLIHPAEGEFFKRPNGLSLRPGGYTLGHIVAHYKKKIGLILIPKGVVVPEGLVLIHEHTDHYSLQTTTSCSEDEMNAKLNHFFDNTPGLQKVSLEEYLKQFPLME